MNILYLSNSILPSKAANSIHVMKMCNAFSKLGHDVFLVGKFVGKRVSQSRIHSYYGTNGGFILLLSKLLVYRGAAITSLFFVYSCISRFKKQDVLIYGRDVYGVSLALLMGYSVMYESHGIPTNSLVFILEKYILSHARLKRFVLISEKLKNKYLENIDSLPTVTSIFHDAADETSPVTELDYEWPTKRKAIQVGYVGHLYKGRGIDVIIGCARALPSYDFHIVGGNEEDIQYWQANSPKNVYFHGFVKPAITSYIRSQCDILLMPYQRNLAVAGKDVDTSEWMSPMKLFEYMASRKPIISSDLPVLREVLDKDSAVLVDPENESDWVNAIISISDKSKMDELSSRAYDLFIAKYTWLSRAKGVLGHE